MHHRTSFLLALIAILALGSVPFLNRASDRSSLSLVSSADAVAVGNKAMPPSLLHRRAPVPQRKGKKRGKKAGKRGKKAGKKGKAKKGKRNQGKKAQQDAAKEAADAAKKAEEEALAQEQQKAIDEALRAGKGLDDAGDVADLVNGAIENVGKKGAPAAKGKGKAKKGQARKGRKARGKKAAALQDSGGAADDAADAGEAGVAAAKRRKRVSNL